jgi:hypothetical protein
MRGEHWSSSMVGVGESFLQREILAVGERIMGPEDQKRGDPMVHARRGARWAGPKQ